VEVSQKTEAARLPMLAAEGQEPNIQHPRPLRAALPSTHDARRIPNSRMLEKDIRILGSLPIKDNPVVTSGHSRNILSSEPVMTPNVTIHWYCYVPKSIVGPDGSPHA